VIGDMASVRAPGSFGLVYLVFNTIGNLTTQEQQIACFANAAAHLKPGGSFVVEVDVPELRRLPPGERHVVCDAARGRWGIDEYDTASQRLVSHHLRADDTSARERAIPFRYVWPSELDLIGTACGHDAGRALGGLAATAAPAREHRTRIGRLAPARLAPRRIPRRQLT
jgi:hypothetical protein